MPDNRTFCLSSLTFRHLLLHKHLRRPMDLPPLFSKATKVGKSSNSKVGKKTLGAGNATDSSVNKTEELV